MPYAWYAELHLDFPEGVHFGAGKKNNLLSIARDGLGRPCLNGSSLAGVLRSIWRNHLQSDPSSTTAEAKDTVQLFFGAASQNDEADDFVATHSAVRVTNTELSLNQSQPALRTHHQRNRHRGSVLDGSLFSAEYCPPGTRAPVRFWIAGPNSSGIIPDIPESLCHEFLSAVVVAFEQGLCIGGNSNRGFGRALLSPPCRTRTFNLSNLSDHADYLDAVRTWAQGKTIPNLKPFVPADRSSASNRLDIELQLSIPRGQDLLVGDGQGLESQTEPQRVLHIDGKYYWRIPGSSLRGIFRNWFHRLHARHQLEKNVDNSLTSSDPVARYADRVREKQYNGNQLGWCFQKPGDALSADWQVESLFGTCHAPGRISLSDGLAACTHVEAAKCSERQVRMHVAVDRITGGAAEGLLFDNHVLTGSPATPLVFTFQLSLQNPADSEIRWLAQTIAALHLGILRIGSAKSSGRLEVHNLKSPSGAGSELFMQVVKSIAPLSSMITT